MAKVVSPVWSWIRGSIAGTTYFTLTSGAIIARQRVKPVQPGTNLQTYIKDGLTFAAASWALLQEATRKAWNTWAAAHSTKTGRQLFIAGQSFQYYGDQSAPTGWPVLAIDQGSPTAPNLPTITVVSAAFTTPASTGVAVRVQNTGVGTVALLIEISVGFSAARNFWKGPWNTSMSKGDTLNAGASKVIEFSGLQAGERYFMRVRGLNTDGDPAQSGRLVTAAWIVNGIATTNP